VDTLAFAEVEKLSSFESKGGIIVEKINKEVKEPTCD
jgi:hypothetical protein